MPTLTTKSDYFAISRSQGLPARCPILDRCERRSNTLAIANGWSFEDSIALAKLRQPVVHVVGESPYSIGGTNNFIAGGLCPEVQLFEASAITGLAGSPTIKGEYDKYWEEPYRVLETGHFSECSEYVAHVSGHGDSVEVAKSESPLERHSKWFVDTAIKIGGLIVQVLTRR